MIPISNNPPHFAWFFFYYLIFQTLMTLNLHIFLYIFFFSVVKLQYLFNVYYCEWAYIIILCLHLLSFTFTHMLPHPPTPTPALSQIVGKMWHTATEMWIIFLQIQGFNIKRVFLASLNFSLNLLYNYYKLIY